MLFFLFVCLLFWLCHGTVFPINIYELKKAAQNGAEFCFQLNATNHKFLLFSFRPHLLLQFSLRSVLKQSKASKGAEMVGRLLICLSRFGPQKALRK